MIPPPPPRFAFPAMVTGSAALAFGPWMVRLADVPLGALRSASLSLRGGGVGFYPKSNFVHVDTGRVRAW